MTNSKVAEAVTADATGQAHQMLVGGMFVADIQRFTGTFNATLQTSLDGDNWTTFYGADGVARTAELSSSRPHVRWEELGQPGQLFRVVFTNAASDTGYYSYTRTAAN